VAKMFFSSSVIFLTTITKLYCFNQFDENVDDEIVKSLQKLFKINYFLYIVDKTIITL